LSILSQVKYIYIALFAIQIVSKLLHSINQNNLTVFVYYWKKDILTPRSCFRAASKIGTCDFQTALPFLGAI